MSDDVLDLREASVARRWWRPGRGGPCSTVVLARGVRGRGRGVPRLHALGPDARVLCMAHRRGVRARGAPGPGRPARRRGASGARASHRAHGDRGAARHGAAAAAAGRRSSRASSRRSWAPRRCSLAEGDRRARSTPREQSRSDAGGPARCAARDRRRRRRARAAERRSASSDASSAFAAMRAHRATARRTSTGRTSW